jgi:hypothetical protein
VAEVVSVLEKLRPLGSLIRIALWNQSMRLAFRRGRARARKGAYRMLARVLPLPPPERTTCLYKLAAIDIHKKVRMVVVAA